MTDPLVEGADDAPTPLTPDERYDLIPSYITTRDQLNEVEKRGDGRNVPQLFPSVLWPPPWLASLVSSLPDARTT